MGRGHQCQDGGAEITVRIRQSTVFSGFGGSPGFVDRVVMAVVLVLWDGEHRLVDVCDGNSGDAHRQNEPPAIRPKCRAPP